MKNFKVVTRWPKTNRIDEEIISAEYYYKKTHTYNFVKDKTNVASFPARTTTIVEVKK